MIGRIWRWLKRLFQRLFGGRHHTHPTIEDTPPPKPLEDADFEYMFRQLLEGVAHGWQQARVVKFFDGLNGRTTTAEWVAWLDRFGEGVLASRASNHELALRMVQLGEIIESTVSLREIGEAAYQIGSQVLTREHTGLVWEYDGPDAEPKLSAPVIDSAGDSTIQQLPTFEEVPQGEVITVDELLIRLQNDPNLVQVIAQQLGIETSDPQVILQEVIKQLDAAEQSTQDS
ncbi:MAG TPA: hypothetical protein DCL61_20290 [Cyanobacteria bacterium UBA12227]|nr:hypothetical protein [Cyanobacteria bacterium UBA12227]HAX89542.1 hypothetical protein [Cyanobacteria bacterium UBA11370]HBY79137.1 hypothetical protein [Cyanobacteria bacterium UBA11148]